MTSVLLTGVLAYGLLLGGLYFGQRALLYHPDQTVPDPRQHGVPEMQSHRIGAADGVDIFAWWHPPSDPTLPVVVYFHGNAGHLGERAYKVRGMIDAGYGVLLATYRYNAMAGGKPSESVLLADGRAVVEFVRAQGIETERIVLYGESLGTGIAVALAVEMPAVAGLILETPYSSIAEVAQNHYWYVPVRWLIRDKFDSVTRIAQVRAPILIIHGDADTTIPLRFAQRLYEAASEPKEAHVLRGGGHTDLYDLGAGDLVLDFLARRTVDDKAA